MENIHPNEIIEDIQDAIIKSGGTFIRSNEIKEMKVIDLLNLLLPNNIEIKIEAR